MSIALVQEVYAAFGRGLLECARIDRETERERS